MGHPVPGFEWDDGNVDHIAEHGVEPAEAEEVFFGRHVVRRSRSRRYVVFGRTYAGRYLFLVVEKKLRGTIRVVTARDMNDRQRQFYLRGGK